MKTDNEEAMALDKRLPDSIDVEHYAATVTAWYETSMERDRSLLNLSAAGIGLLLTLATTIGIGGVPWLIVYILALLSFVICLGAVLWIFRANRKHLEDVIRLPSPPASDPLLRRLDNCAVSSFVAGAVFACIIGIGTAIKSFQASERREIVVSKKQETPVERANHSVSGAASLRTTRDAAATESRSFDGAATLKPVTQQQTQQPAQPTGNEQSGQGSQSAKQ